MRLALYVGVLSIAIAPAFAQSQLGTGAISGVVQDASSGVVTGAEVTITNAETGLMRKLVSSAGGQFNAPVLPPGSYQLRVSHPGFSTLEQKDIVVNVGSTATVVAALQVGGVAETVTVQATAIIDTAKTDESNLIDRKSIQDLPINGRRYYDFALLSAGVTRDARLGLLSFRGSSGSFNNYNGFGTTLYTAAVPSATTLLATPIKLTPTAGFFAPNNDGTPPDETNARRLQLSIRFLRFAKEAVRLGGVDRMVSLSSVASAVCAALATGARK